jgi:hypothetical protein
VAVLVIGIGGHVAHPHREQGDEGSHQVEAGVQRFGENAEASGRKAHDNLEGRDQPGGKNGVARNSAFVRAHGLCVECFLCHSLPLGLG